METRAFWTRSRGGWSWELGLDSSIGQDPLRLEKLVFAHFMVGNTYPYTQDDWLQDLILASENEIDGFALNVGVEQWQKDRVRDCYKACERLPMEYKFKLFFSFDMTSIPGQAKKDVRYLSSYMQAFANHPRTLRYPPRTTGKIVVSTFSGGECLFGMDTLEKGWAFLREELSNIVPIHLIPSFFIDPARYPGISCLDGTFNWNGGWPIHLNPSLPRSDIECPKLDSDIHHLKCLNEKQTFMAAVSPWFFTHYGPNSWNKNWVYRADDWLFVRRWEWLIEMRSRIDFIQIISWNDYGESHYIGPIKGAQPNSEAWVDGYPHEPWLYLNSYFARAFKDGVYPDIQEDKIFVWARPHPKDVIVNEQVPRPKNWELTDDLMWIIIFSINPAIVKVYTSELNGDCTSIDVETGMTKLSHKLKLAGGMKLVMIRDEKIVAECAPIGYRFEAWPGVYNFNAFVAMSH